jgi:putative FmdB family regulatory protein
MPLYEYLCDACGHRFEKIQKFSDPLIEECPKCGEKQVHKLVSSPAIQFKGTGWYITDYAKKNTVDGSKPGDSKDGDGKSNESKSDSKDTGAKAGDSKSSDAKGSESKAADGKSSESKSSETKTPTTTS